MRRGVPALCLEPVHQIDGVVEPHSGATARAGAADRDGEMGFAGSRTSDENGIALAGG